MPLGKSDLSARLRSSYEQLASSAQALNNASDELTKIVSSLDSAIKKLNLGIDAWVTIRAGSDEEGRYSYEDQLEYTKINGRWGIAIRQIQSNEMTGEEQVTNEWLFADAPRELRISTVEHLPKLIEKLLESVKHTKDVLHKKLEDARGMLEAVEELASETGTPGVKK
jgi:hypothetical protein